MRKIEKDLIAAIEADKPFKRGPTAYNFKRSLTPNGAFQ